MYYDQLIEILTVGQETERERLERENAELRAQLKECKHECWRLKLRAENAEKEREELRYSFKRARDEASRHNEETAAHYEAIIFSMKV